MSPWNILEDIPGDDEVIMNGLTSAEKIQLSMAISLKRIADKLDQVDLNQLNQGITEAIWNALRSLK